jgi:hypothetical protein
MYPIITSLYHSCNMGTLKNSRYGMVYSSVAYATPRMGCWFTFSRVRNLTIFPNSVGMAAKAR